METETAANAQQPLKRDVIKSSYSTFTIISVLIILYNASRNKSSILFYTVFLNLFIFIERFLLKIKVYIVIFNSKTKCEHALNL